MNRLPREWVVAVTQMLERELAVVRIVVAEVRGSAPREAGAFMLVGRGCVEGTIGGGRLEWESIAAARELLDDASAGARLSKVVLGADLGQCCGGVVAVWLERFARDDIGLLRLAGDAGARGPAVLSSTIKGGVVERQLVGGAVGRDVTRAAAAVRDVLAGATDRAGVAAAGTAGPDYGAGRGEVAHGTAAGGGDVGKARPVDSVATRAAELLASPRSLARPVVVRDGEGQVTFLERLDDELPALWLYGAGHVGQALARILAELPLRLTWVDSRGELFPAVVPQGVRIRRDADSLATVSDAPPGAFFLVMTHSHPLDFALCQAILTRNDFAWLGLIGSASKAARFRSRLARGGVNAATIGRLVCPIGVEGIESKWPTAIAVAVAAQVMQQISAAPQLEGSEQCEGAQRGSRAPSALRDAQEPSVRERRAPEASARSRALLARDRASSADPARSARAEAADCGGENCATCGADASAGAGRVTTS